MTTNISDTRPATAADPVSAPVKTDRPGPPPTPGYWRLQLPLTRSERPLLLTEDAFWNLVSVQGLAAIGSLAVTRDAPCGAGRQGTGWADLARPLHFQWPLRRMAAGPLHFQWPLRRMAAGTVLVRVGDLGRSERTMWRVLTAALASRGTAAASPSCPEWCGDRPHGRGSDIHRSGGLVVSGNSHGWCGDDPDCSDNDIVVGLVQDDDDRTPELCIGHGGDSLPYLTLDEAEKLAGHITELVATARGGSR